MLGIARRDQLIVRAVEDERGLAEIGVVLVAGAIVDELVTQLAMTVLAIVVNVHRAGAAPFCDAYGAEALGPAPGKAESRREQHHASDFGVARGIERGEISAQAGTDQRDGTGGRGAFDDGELGGDGEVLEIAGGQVWNGDPRSGVFQALAEVAGFGRGR